MHGIWFLHVCKPGIFFKIYILIYGDSTCHLPVFHWYTPCDGQWWSYCSNLACELAALGVTHVYLPPAYKSALVIHEPGYAVYDLYDPGEFDQKKTIRTKYDTKEEYIARIESFHQHGIKVIGDIVLNHKPGGDEKKISM